MLQTVDSAQHSAERETREQLEWKKEECVGEVATSDIETAVCILDRIGIICVYFCGGGESICTSLSAVLKPYYTLISTPVIQMLTKEEYNSHQ